MGADRDGVGGRRSAVRRLQAPPHPLAVEEAEAEEEEEGGGREKEKTSDFACQHFIRL